MLCTGHSELVSGEKGKEGGISEFIMKRMVKRELAETIGRVLDVKMVGDFAPMLAFKWKY
jgi:hypothetical protein